MFSFVYYYRAEPFNDALISYIRFNSEEKLIIEKLLFFNIMESQPTEGNNIPDRRLEFMGFYVIKTLKLKPEKWQRITSIEENKAIIKEFLDRPIPIVLIIILTPSAQLIPLTTFPLNQLKNKGVYFIKKYLDIVPKDDNIKNFLIFGDLSTRSIDQLSSLVDEIFIPLLSNENNYKNWPDMVAHDVQKHIHSLKSTVHQVKGQVSGQTILAIPVGIEKIMKASNELLEKKFCTIDLYLKSAIEGVVIKWATQINDVVTDSSLNTFSNGQNPIPSAGNIYIYI